MRKDKVLNGDLDRLPMLACRSSRRQEAHSEESEIRSPTLIRALSPRCYEFWNSLTSLIFP